MSNKNNDDWIYSIIPKEDVADREYKANRLENMMDRGISIVMSASHDSAISLIKAYRRSHTQDLDAWIQIMDFVETLMRIIEEHLKDEGVELHD